jgi:hypothetical protein
MENEVINNEDLESSDPVDLLDELLEHVFDDNTQNLATALGRNPDEIDAWLDGTEPIDEDAQIKIRGIAQERLEYTDNESDEETADSRDVHA